MPGGAGAKVEVGDGEGAGAGMDRGLERAPIAAADGEGGEGNLGGDLRLAEGSGESGGEAAGAAEIEGQGGTAEGNGDAVSEGAELGEVGRGGRKLQSGSLRCSRERGTRRVERALEDGERIARRAEFQIGSAADGDRGDGGLNGGGRSDGGGLRAIHPAAVDRRRDCAADTEFGGIGQKGLDLGAVQ